MKSFYKTYLAVIDSPPGAKTMMKKSFFKTYLAVFVIHPGLTPLPVTSTATFSPIKCHNDCNPKLTKGLLLQAPTANKTITESPRQSTDSKEPKTKQQRTGDEKLMTLMTPTPTTKSQPTISGRTNVARQLDVPVPKGVLWDVCSFNTCHTVKTVVELVKQRIQIRLAQFKPACFKIGIASDPESRFHDGYINEGYAFMEVLWCSTPANCVAVETDSVDLFIGAMGCHNATRGGGGVDATRKDYQQHVYVVFSPISFLINFRLERARGLALLDFPMGIFI